MNSIKKGKKPKPLQFNFTIEYVGNEAFIDLLFSPSPTLHFPNEDHLQHHNRPLKEQPSPEPSILGHTSTESEQCLRKINSVGIS